MWIDKKPHKLNYQAPAPYGFRNAALHIRSSDERLGWSPKRQILLRFEKPDSIQPTEEPPFWLTIHYMQQESERSDKRGELYTKIFHFSFFLSYWFYLLPQFRQQQSCIPVRSVIRVEIASAVLCHRFTNTEKWVHYKYGSSNKAKTYLRMKLLLSSCVAICARIPGLAQSTVQPLVPGANNRTWGASVAPFVWRATFIFSVMIERTRITLTTHTWRFLAQLGLVTCQHVEHFWNKTRRTRWQMENPWEKKRSHDVFALMRNKNVSSKSIVVSKEENRPTWIWEWIIIKNNQIESRSSS